MRSLQLSSTPARWLIALLFAAAALASLPASANSWPLPAAGSRLIGQNVFHVVADDGGSLEAIAKKYNVGFLALLQANPGVDPYVPRAGSVLTIPRQMLLPDAPREGLVVNLAELRVYYYPAGKNSVTVYPIGIGQLGGDTMTPTMQTTAPTSGQIPPGRLPRTSGRAIWLTALNCLPWCPRGRITRWGITLSGSRLMAACICCTAPMRILA
jgi:L,D-transpeptidase YcfS